MPTRPPTHRPNGQTYSNERERKREFQRTRSDKDRQRFYQSEKWRRCRKRFISQHPLCADCEEQGRLTEAEEVHHKIDLADAPELAYEPSNLQGLCKSCHSRRTARTTIAIGKGQ